LTISISPELGAGGETQLNQATKSSELGAGGETQLNQAPKSPTLGTFIDYIYLPRIGGGRLKLIKF